MFYFTRNHSLSHVFCNSQRLLYLLKNEKPPRIKKQYCQNVEINANITARAKHTTKYNKYKRKILIKISRLIPTPASFLWTTIYNKGCNSALNANTA